ncbi:MAG TPA: RING finger protein [Acidobacteriota bacterium]|nr:RING finger protein [Acidobacteriota bacterium]
MPNIPFIVYIVLISVLRIIFRSFYGSRRYRKYVLSRFRDLLQDLQSRYGGVVNGWSNWAEYVLPDGLRIRASNRGRPALRLFYPHYFQFSAHMYRVPDFLFSWIGPFLPESARMTDLPYIINGNMERFNSPTIHSLLERFSRSGYSIHINSNGMTLTKTLSPDDGMEIPFVGILRALRELARLLDRPTIEIPVNELSKESKCAYCKEEMLAGFEVTHCLECGTPHHSECFDLNGKCAVFGCSSYERERSRQEQPIVQ